MYWHENKRNDIFEALKALEKLSDNISPYGTSASNSGAFTINAAKEVLISELKARL